MPGAHGPAASAPTTGDLRSGERLYRPGARQTRRKSSRSGST